MEDQIHWVTRYSRRGFPYRMMESVVPRIPDVLVDCVVYLYPSEAAAEDGEHLGGCGFLLGSLLSQTAAMLFVVTNRHVIERGSMIVRINTRDGKKDIIPLDGAEWILHPDGDDIAVCPIGLNVTHHRVQFLPTHMLLTKAMIEEHDIGLGDDTFMIGRFVSHEGKQKNMPSVRFGNIAQMPIEPIVMDDGFEQECFLIEARSIPGYSGSPVFFMIPPQPKPPFQLAPDLPQDIKDALPEILKRSGFNPKRDAPVQLGPWLLGIDFCHLFNKDKIISDLTGKPVSDDWHVRSNTGMMGVIPAWKLTDMIERTEMAKIIDKAKADLKRAASPAALDVADEKAAPAASDANPNHRADFNSLLDAAVKTPAQED